MAQTVPSTPDATTRAEVSIGVPKETVDGERRVSLIPDTVSRLTGSGVEILVEAGAGEGSSISDDEYAEAGATIVPDAAALFKRANLMIKVQAPSHGAHGGNEVAAMRPETTLISFLAPLVNHDLVKALAQQRITSFSMDAVPRTTRAQTMDAISAMTTISGYKAVLLAADHLPKFFPLLMTAAGTIRPAKVLIIGAGVAGLQAIATARRLGAVVEAYDTRPVVKEQVESLGAKFVEIDTGSSDTQDAGGYARAATEEELRRQQEGLNGRIAESDVVITTALVPGRPAPRLIPASAVAAMRTGSVIVDLAAESGGNCELTEPGETVVREGVTIIGLLNLPSTMPVHASQMYARTIQNLLGLMIKDGKLNLNMEDDIIRGMCVTLDGEIVHEQTRKAMGLDPVEAPAPVAEPELADDPALVDEPVPLDEPMPADGPDVGKEPQPVTEPEPAIEPEPVAESAPDKDDADKQRVREG
ncbi:MAG: Re/Si-specific NAD(P)(+) transhydrogenase subunit alpha [Chloroflexia bacterium]|nr:Re/Si-specific NAD(P)(+) transhydrogenase subunit alpha [Chloroflexia bacterium]